MSRFQVSGLYVVVGGAMPPAAVLLGIGEVKLFDDRERVCGREKALHETFGNLCDYAFHANDASLGYLMESAGRDGLPYAEELAALAARIVTGKPIGRDDGGQRAKLVPVIPRKPSPSGRVFEPATVAATR